MAAPQHPLERRAALLAGRITSRMTDLTDSLVSAQGRRPFTDLKSRPDALAWWRENRYNQYGLRALATLPPEAVTSLDAALAQGQQQQQDVGMPQVAGQLGVAEGGGWPAT